MKNKEKIKELERLLHEADRASSKAFQKNYASLEAFQAGMRPHNQKIAELTHQLQELEPVEWEEWDGNGDMFTLKNWIANVKGGGFIDYDGFGHYSDGKRESNKTVSPSHVKKGWLLKNPEFTHIIWYNR